MLDITNAEKKTYCSVYLLLFGMFCLCPLTRLCFSLFKVSEGSEVHFQPGNFSLSCQIQKEAFSHGNEHLLNWAQKKYRAVTSFSELRMTQDIYIKVGEGTRFPKFPT